MKRTGLIAAVLLMALLGCNGQIKNEKKPSENDDNPQATVKVNKEYDEDGNLIRYDSTYSSFYSSTENQQDLRDSIYNEFRSYFNKNYSFSDEPFFDNFFFEDSLLKYDFYKKDFFLKRFRDNMARMDSLFWGMDSLKNNFFSREFDIPGVLKAPKE